MGRTAGETVVPEAHLQAPASGSLALAERYRSTRGLSEALCAPLSEADATIQSMPDASPAKWHLAHTTWFFETFVLRDHALGYQPFDERYAFLFNSYYEAEGPRHPDRAGHRCSLGHRQGDCGPAGSRRCVRGHCRS